MYIPDFSYSENSKNFRSQELSLPGTFAPGSEISLPGTFVPWDYHSLSK